MKRLFMILATSAALSAWGQGGLEAPKTAGGAGANSGQSTAVWIQGADGRMHELRVPVTLGQLQGLVQGPGVVDLEHTNSNQAGCPVQILNASFDRPAQLMLTSHVRTDDAPTLQLEYRNSSGKEIDSVLLTGWIKVKDSPYRLDSVAHPFELELSPKMLRGDGGKAFRLVSNAIGFDRIELSRVIYADGSTWTPERQSCVYANQGLTQRAKDW
jgi:hypothetical protein